MPRVLDTADAIHYVETAQHLAAGNFFGYDPKIPLFYPLLGALAHFMVSDLEWACRLVSLIASTLTVVPVFLLARDLFDARAARMAGVLFACWPWLADYACRVSTEATAIFLWFSALWLLQRGLRHGGWTLYLSPFAFFALCLTRPEGLFILLCSLPAALILGWKTIPQLGRRLCTVAALAGLCLLLNTLYVRQLTGETTANYRIGFILQEFDYLRFVQTTVKSFSDVLPVMLGPILSLFLGVGLFNFHDRKRDVRLEAFVLFFAAAQWGISLFVLSPAPRYLMATLIALSLWAAFGLVIVTTQLAQKDRPRWLVALPVLSVLGFFLLHTLITVGSEHLGRRPREPREYKDAGRWMAEHLPHGLIFTRKPQVGYYAGMPSTGPALEDSLEEALIRARDAQAAYFVVDERYTAQMVPSLRPLLDENAHVPGLDCVHVVDQYPQARVVIYQLLPEVSP